MSHYKIFSGALAIAALVTFTSAVQADHNYGPRQKNGQCWTTSGPNAIGYWSPCPNTAARTGTTANARVTRPSSKQPAGQQPAGQR
jgi:hypothetical protein